MASKRATGFLHAEDFKTVLADLGYVPSTMDSQVYIPVYAGGSEILLMHVDDGLLFYRDEAMAARIIDAMRARYGPDMHDRNLRSCRDAHMPCWPCVYATRGPPGNTPAASHREVPRGHPRPQL
jgi:hypothetical protein